MCGLGRPGGIVGQRRPQPLVAGRGGLQRGGRPGTGCIAGRVPGPHQQGLGPLRQPGDGGALLGGGPPQRPDCLRLAGQGVLLRLDQGDTGLEQFSQGVGGGTGELIGRPDADRGPPQGGHPSGCLAVASGLELADRPVTGGDELGQGKPVEPCDRGVEVAACGRPPHRRSPRLPRVPLITAAHHEP
jgi:hypothetical protein